MTKPTPPPPKRATSKKPPVLPPRQEKKAPAKHFSVGKWDTGEEGKRIILYADSGFGKTTLCSMLPNPKFADFRGGSDKILHPVTGERLDYIQGIETLDDMQAICNQDDLLDKGDSLVIDTGTAFEEEIVLPWMFANIPHEKGARTIKRIEDYGYGKGYRHLYDTMRIPLAHFDRLIRRGVNVVITCQMQQIEVAHAGGENFLCDVPKLQVAHGKNNNVPPVWGLYVEWADEVYKIGYGDIKTEDGKAASTGERVIFTNGEPHFKAKSRTLPIDIPLVTFSEPSDNSIWEFLFKEQMNATTG